MINSSKLICKRVFFEKLLLNKIKNSTFLYHSVNHKSVKFENYFESIINCIIEDDGFINYNKIKKVFKFKTGDDLSYYGLNDMISKLVQEKVFFISKQKFLSEKKSFIAEYKSRKIPNIQVVYIHMSHRCNFNCWYCYNKKLKKHKAEELRTQEWLKIIDVLKEFNPKEFIFTGGEPLLRDDLEIVMKKSKELGVHVNLLTNGSLLTEDRLRRIIPFVDDISISLDSLNLDEQKLNRSKEGFESIINILDYIKRKKLYDKISIKTVVTKQNIKGINEFFNVLYNKYKIKKRTLTRFIPNSISQLDLIPDLGLFQDTVGNILKPDKTIDTSSDNFYGLRCKAGNMIIAIDCKGDLFPCQNFLSYNEFSMGNILDKKWYNKYIDSNIRKVFSQLTVDDIPECNKCHLRYFCGAGCPAISYNLYGSLNKKIDYQCNENKIQAETRLLKLSNKNT